MQTSPYIIAGASSGIGFSLAQQLISEGHQVVGLSRSPGPLAGESGYTHLSWDAMHEEVPELPSIAAGLVYAPGSILLKPFGRLTDTEEIIKASAERHPLKRIGQPGDIAAAVRFLLSSQSGWITGQILPVDGGISAIRSI
jgi:NAD(P)-dependent dehydrogenase (short-subunit alcohol dehydrogenase family)